MSRAEVRRMQRRGAPSLRRIERELRKTAERAFQEIAAKYTVQFVCRTLGFPDPWSVNSIHDAA